jgi:hypothetical protein
MKDVELVANLLLFFEDGIRGYSQDELDEAFSDRDTTWDNAASSRTQFVETSACIRQIIAKPTNDPLFKTRLRNQADFYSLFTAVAESMNVKKIVCFDDTIATRLHDFVGRVEDENLRAVDKAAGDYFKAARSNSNDSGPRKKRHEITLKVLNDSLHDYSSADTEQVQVS